MTNELGQKKISRRTVAKGAAWSVPVVAVAAAAPAHAASAPTTGDVIISVACNTLELLGSVPTYTISVTGTTLGAGSTFIMGGPALANVQLNGSGLSVGLLSNGQRTLTTSDDIAPGGSVSVAVSGILGVFALSALTLSTGTLIGNPNTDSSNDSATANLTGVGAVGTYTGTCIVA